MKLCHNCKRYMTMPELYQSRENSSRFYCIYCARFRFEHGRYPHTLYEALIDEGSQNYD